MESAAAAVSVGGSAPGYPDSVDSSPRSRGGDPWDEPFPSSAAAASSRLRLMVSYGGRIVPRPTDKSLCYLGGETRMVVVDRHSSLVDFSAKLSRKLLGGRPFSLKYQLPNEDLDSLISVATDEDLENMIEELDRISAGAAADLGRGGGSNRSSRLRLFLFPSKSESSPSSSIGSLLDESKSETWFVDALNSAIGGMGMDGLPRGFSADSATANGLLGVEDDSSVHSRRDGTAAAILEPGQLGLSRPESSGKLARHVQEVHSVPDSPMLDTTSSFGSTSSAPSLSHLPPIPVPTDDRLAGYNIAGLDDHMVHMTLSSDSTVHASSLQSPPPLPLLNTSGSTAAIPQTENPNRVFSDDERSDHGAGRPPRPTKSTELDASTDQTLRPAYMNPNSDMKVSSDPSYRLPPPVMTAPGYVFPSAQLEQLQKQQPHHHQQPHFIPTNSQYIQHQVAGAMVPMASYYPIASHPMHQSPQTHQFNTQVPMYYVPVGHTAPYTLTALQPNSADPSSIPSSGKPTVPVAGVATNPDLPATMFNTSVPAPAVLQPQLIHVAATQTHPYTGAGYHMIQPPQLSQPSLAMANYGYEIGTNPGNSQMYYSQVSATSQQPPSQHQTVSSAAVLPKAAAPGDITTSRAS